MKKVKTLDLTVSAIDWAASQALGMKGIWIAKGNHYPHLVRDQYAQNFTPTGNWAHTGVVLEALTKWAQHSFSIILGRHGGYQVVAEKNEVVAAFAGKDDLNEVIVLTFVLAHFGSFIEVPDELVPVVATPVPDLAEVIAQILPLVPKDQIGFIHELKLIKSSAEFATPELMSLHWGRLEEVGNTYLAPLDECNEWQRKVMDVLMAKANAQVSKQTQGETDATNSV